MPRKGLFYYLKTRAIMEKIKEFVDHALFIEFYGETQGINVYSVHSAKLPDFTTHIIEKGEYLYSRDELIVQTQTHGNTYVITVPVNDPINGYLQDMVAKTEERKELAYTRAGDTWIEERS
jgi:hypothetical protein